MSSEPIKPRQRQEGEFEENKAEKEKNPKVIGIQTKTEEEARKIIMWFWEKRNPDMLRFFEKDPFQQITMGDRTWAEEVLDDDDKKVGYKIRISGNRAPISKQGMEIIKELDLDFEVISA